jgi:hypothetical protein
MFISLLYNDTVKYTDEVITEKVWGKGSREPMPFLDVSPSRNFHVFGIWKLL